MKNKQFGILGAGRFGEALAITLSELGADVIVVDKDKEKIQEIANQVTFAVQADVTDINVLRSIGLQNVDIVVVAITQNINASIMAVINAQELGIKPVYAKAISRQHEKVLLKLGVSRVFSPERDMGERVARQFYGGHFIEMLDLDTDHSIVEIDAPTPWIGHNLADLDLRQKYGINVIAIHRLDKLNLSPKASDVIKREDKMVVLGDTSVINKLQSLSEDD